MKGIFLTILVTLCSIYSFSQCIVIEKTDEFYGIKLRETNTVKIGKLGYVTEIKLLQSDTIYTMYVDFGDMSDCSVNKNDKIMFKSGTDIRSLKSEKLFISKLEILPSTRIKVYKNYVYYPISIADLDWLINNNVEKIRIEHSTGFKDLELKSNDGKIISDLAKCIKSK